MAGLRVFVSYPRGGVAHTLAERVHEDLAARGADVWRDEQRIGEGDDDWCARIEQGLVAADAVAFIVGADSAASRWQRREIVAADQMGLPVVAFRVAPVQLPFYAIEKQPVELRDPAAPDASLAHLAAALVDAVRDASPRRPVTGADAAPPPAQRQQELDFLNALLFSELSDREARYEPVAGEERESLSLARSHKGLRIELTTLFEAFGPPGAEQSHAPPMPWPDVLDAYRSLAGRRVRRLVVLGEPGAGKTFSIERIACHHARLALESPAAPLPLLLRLGRWTREDEPLLAFAEREIGTLGRQFGALRDGGRAVLLLDGLNEIPPGQRRMKAEQLRRIAEDERFAAVVLSCRHRDYEADYALPYDTLTLQPLTPPQVHRFVHRAYAFDKGPERGAELAERRFWQIAGGEALRAVWTIWRQAGASIDQFWTADDVPREKPNVYRKTSGDQDELWRIARHGSRTLLRLASNPYLLFVMTALPVIPNNRAMLFDGFLTVLHERERQARDGRHDARSVPEVGPWRAALTELAEAFQRVAPPDAEAPDPAAPGAATTLPRTDWPASITPNLLAFSIDASVLQLAGDDLRFSHQLLQEALASRVLLQAGADGARPAHHFWLADRWWQRNGWDVVAEIAAEACGGDMPRLEAFIGWLAEGNPEVAHDAWRRAGAPPLSVPLAQGIAQRWLPRLTDARAVPAPAARAAIGRALGGFDLDRRPGVGLRDDGVPDIDWVTIGGERPFVYQDGARLTLPTFRIARFLVTHRQFQAFVDAGGYAEDRWWQGLARRVDAPAEAARREPNAPRDRVNWYEAVAFCRWLSQAMACDIALPTERQWERAARGRKGAEYPWGDGYRVGCANCDELGSMIDGGTRIGRTTAVGIYPFASAEGVHDLAGNVWEWCLDEFDRPEHRSTSGVASRVLRGGSWSNNARLARAAYRVDGRAEGRTDYIGFRVCGVAPVGKPPAGAPNAGPPSR